MIDLVLIHAISGSGGNGSSSFRREKYAANGGPDGGDGGNGGDVIFVADENLTTLAHFRHQRFYKAQHGVAGAGGKRHGANGESLTLKVPVGTVVKVADDSAEYDFDQHGKRVIVARGGEGGRGNARFSNSIRQAPNFFERGLPGEDLELTLELKLLADVGLIGLPNAGKSTLLRAVSHAMPDVGDFPFTTLEPVLGVVDLGYTGFVIADLPGLIEGAHAGAGLGHQFLRHVDRTRVLVHMLDTSAEDPLASYHLIRRELELHDPRLMDRPEIVALNKVDLPEARERAETLRNAFPDREVLEISGATGAGTDVLIKTLQRMIQETTEKREAAVRALPEELPVLRPRGRDRLDVTLEDDIYVIHSDRAEDAALKLGQGGYEAMDELQDRLRRFGIEKVLRRAGARPGARLRVGAVEMEWQG